MKKNLRSDEVSYIFKINKKKAEQRQIEEFENEVFKKVVASSLFFSLKEELSLKKLNFKIEVQHTESDLIKYCSHLVIDIFDENNEVVYMRDEPNCCVMLCEPICFTRGGYIIGIDLLSDKEFLDSLKLLINQIKNNI